MNSEKPNANKNISEPEIIPLDEEGKVDNKQEPAELELNSIKPEDDSDNNSHFPPSVMIEKSLHFERFPLDEEQKQPQRLRQDLIEMVTNN